MMAGGLFGGWQGKGGARLADAMRGSAVACLRSAVQAEKLGDYAGAVEWAVLAENDARLLGASGRALAAAAARVCGRAACALAASLLDEREARAEYDEWTRSGACWGLW